MIMYLCIYVCIIHMYANVSSYVQLVRFYIAFVLELIYSHKLNFYFTMLCSHQRINCRPMTVPSYS